LDQKPWRPLPRRVVHPVDMARRASTLGVQSSGGGEFTYLSADGQSTAGFNISFILPFKREDLWQELVADRMVGTDNDDEIKYTIIRTGNDEENPVSVGCVREATYGSPVHGRTVSELLELKAPSYIKWATLLQTDTVYEFIGRSDETPPSIALALKENKRTKAHPEGGTTVTIKYDYSQVVVHGLFCCLSCFASDYIKSRMQKTLPEKWKDSMIHRGYAPLTASRKMKTAEEIKKQMEEQAKLKREQKKKQDDASGKGR